jgi:acetyl esterase/lipase
VFAPPDASPINPKPVMFWLFGGNNDFGTASLAFYNGSSLAVNEGVVVVAINYRTNSTYCSPSGIPHLSNPHPSLRLLQLARNPIRQAK